jgi:hypothetical protein
MANGTYKGSTTFEEATAKAKKKSEGEALQDTINKAAEARAGRRGLFEEGAEDLLALGEKAPGIIRGEQERSLAQTLAAAGPQSDLRTLAGASAEQRKAAAGQILQAQQDAAAGKLDIAVAAEDVGDIAQDVEQRRTELTSQMHAVIDKYKGFFDDDEDSMYREIMASVSSLPTTGPLGELRREFEQRAQDIKDRVWDV